MLQKYLPPAGHRPVSELFEVVVVYPNTSDVEVEEVYSWLQRAINENMGPGRDLQGGPTWTMRDFLRVIKEESPRAFGEMLREAND